MATESGREAFGLMVLVASLGTAWLASALGLSMTVGAFLAGLVIDESEFSHQIHAEIRPVRDLLTSLFFISVGLLVNPAAAVAGAAADAGGGDGDRGAEDGRRGRRVAAGAASRRGWR